MYLGGDDKIPNILTEQKEGFGMVKVKGRKGSSERDAQLYEDAQASNLISEADLEAIRESLTREHAGLVVRALLDSDARAQLEKIIADDYRMQTKGDKNVIQYVARETIGTGVIEDIIESDKSVTDIAWNGSELIVETNDTKTRFNSSMTIDEDYIARLIARYANATGKSFTPKDPIFDGRFDNVRINAVHTQNTAPESGTTMALRIVRPRLALTVDNFEHFAPKFLLPLIEAFVVSRLSMLIGGSTGTGKTELHKLIASFTPFNDRIALIEDTPETFLKSMLSDKDIMSWVTSENVQPTNLIKAALRNNPVWIQLTETRGKEAYEMFQAILSGHPIITSLHVSEVAAIPSRFVNMSKMGYQFDEASFLDDVYSYLDVAFFIRKIRYKGRMVRFLSELAIFTKEGMQLVFKQRFVEGEYRYETFDLPPYVYERFEDYGVSVDFPKNIKGKSVVDITKHTIHHIIPIDDKGFPDRNKMRSMGIDEADVFKDETVDSGFRPRSSNEGSSVAGLPTNVAMAQLIQLLGQNGDVNQLLSMKKEPKASTLPKKPPVKIVPQEEPVRIEADRHGFILPPQEERTVLTPPPKPRPIDVGKVDERKQQVLRHLTKEEPKPKPYVPPIRRYSAETEHEIERKRVEDLVEKTKRNVKRDH